MILIGRVYFAQMGKTGKFFSAVKKAFRSPGKESPSKESERTPTRDTDREEVHKDPSPAVKDFIMLQRLATFF